MQMFDIVLIIFPLSIICFGVLSNITENMEHEVIHNIFVTGLVFTIYAAAITYIIFGIFNVITLLVNFAN